MGELLADSSCRRTLLTCLQFVEPESSHMSPTILTIKTGPK
jgi:hypothetical protein